MYCVQLLKWQLPRIIKFNFNNNVPGSGGALIGSSYDYAYGTRPNNVSCLASRGAACRFARGRVLGGSTAINLMMYTRGSPHNYEYDLPGWTWDDIKPYFLRYEGLRDLHKLPASSRPYHNTSGVVPIGYFQDVNNPWQKRIIKGFNALNIPFNADINGASQIGVSKVLAFTANGERVNTAESYLNIPGVRKNLRLLKNTKCLKIIIDERNTAKGVIVIRNNEIYRMYAKKEVILSAGTIGSTHLLLLSGIGPAEHLRKHNIPVKADLPVGRDMSDHFAPLVYMKVNDQPTKSNVLAVGSKVIEGLEWLLARRGPLSTSGLTDITTFVNTKCYDFKLKRLLHDRPECDVPTSQYIHAYLERGFARLAKPIYDRVIGHVPEVADQMVVENDKSGFIVVTLPVLQPYSRGWIELASADVYDAPVISPNYLHDDRDVQEIVRAIRILEDLTQTPEYRAQNASLFKYKLAGCPDGEEEGYWACYARHMTYSVYHAGGTVSLGGVLDARLRVRGVRRLRVADASVLPRLPAASTAAVALAIGERVVDFLLEDDTHNACAYGNATML
ncbi:glucose dehydrogenase [FAD, quinone]-like [Colias croceus]|uniref:glucose dehydrogenase [FAD, quinone]-like n=1 Tax=Colias crocea TaxID=72248 RepID=UPI001E27DE23|nr:glucose dehydrogenase [FAD, quinone]-like [Colias croceus]